MSEINIKPKKDLGFLGKISTLIPENINVRVPEAWMADAVIGRLKELYPKFMPIESEYNKSRQSSFNKYAIITIYTTNEVGFVDGFYYNEGNLGKILTCEEFMEKYKL